MRAEITLGFFNEGMPGFRNCFVHGKIGNAHKEAENQQHNVASWPFADCARFIAFRLPLKRDLNHRDDGVRQRKPQYAKQSAEKDLRAKDKRWRTPSSR